MQLMRTTRLWAALMLGLPLTLAAQGNQARPDTTNPIQEGLPLAPARTIRFTTDVGSWMSLDISPDGQTLVFDHLGDLFTVPITGGKAMPLTLGMALDAQPRFSPDGKRIAFISDRKGASNLWVLSLDKKDTVQVTRDRTQSFDSPEFTPDGKYIVVSRGNNLHMYHVDGGSGVQLPRQDNAQGQQAWRYMGAAFGKDSRYMWTARRQGAWNYNTPMGANDRNGDYALYIYDRETGEYAVRATRWGGAFRPTLSPDGKWLVYGTRHDQKTGLVLRDLNTGAECWLAYPVQRDDQESRASRDAYPGMTFTPDSRELIATWSGKIWRVPVASAATTAGGDGNVQSERCAGGEPRQIPFTVDVEQHLGPEVKFEYAVSDTPTFTVRQIRNAVPSPDGRRLAFTAMSRLYVQDIPSGTPRMVAEGSGPEFQPGWSPDGQWLTYVTWREGEGGYVWKVRSNGGRPVRLTTASAFYAQPAFSPDGQRVLALRSSAPAYAEETTQGGADLVWVSSNGGATNLVAPSPGISVPHFVKGSDRIYASAGGRGLISMRWDGTDIKEHVRVSGPPAPGGGGGGGANASLIMMAPEGDQALAQVNNDVYVVTVPVIGGTTPAVTVGDNSNFPSRKLTDIGGQFPIWSWDGRKVHYSIGNAHVIYDLDRAKAFDDSVRIANRTRQNAPRDTTAGRDTAAADSARPLAQQRPGGQGPGQRSTPGYKPQEFRVIVHATRDTPQGTAVLRGGRVVTMRGNEVIENADIVIRNNRIAAVGARGQVQIPEGANVIDVSGTTITPGFVDTHAHLRLPQSIHRGQIWSYAANLAWGVTTTRDPQTGTTDVLTYEDMLDAGEIIGPRSWSTGPGVFSGENFRSLDHARSVLKRYSEYYNTGTFKQYVAGNREQRQWIIQAAREQKLMPTTEGSLDLEMNITEAIDGYSGHEHTWPSYPFQDDLIRFFAQSGIVYTPTVLVAYGGPWAENYWYETTEVHSDPKVRRFLPHGEVDSKTLRRGNNPNPTSAGWFHQDEHVMDLVSEHIADLIAAGGKAGVGSHGQFQGLGYHWELWSMAFGKLKPHDALRAATIMGAEAIGRGRDVGTVEAGKLADLVIMDRNPLENIRNSNSIRYVMKNGRLYDGNSLDEVWPRQRKANFYWQSGDPKVTTDEVAVSRQ